MSSAEMEAVQAARKPPACLRRGPRALLSAKDHLRGGQQRAVRLLCSSAPLRLPAAARGKLNTTCSFSCTACPWYFR